MISLGLVTEFLPVEMLLRPRLQLRPVIAMLDYWRSNIGPGLSPAYRKYAISPLSYGLVIFL